MRTPDPKSISYASLAPKLRTGDLLLFHGASAVSKSIERSIRSRFSHVAIVIRPYLNRPPLIFQAGVGPLLEDQHSHSMHGGAQLSYLREMLLLMKNPAYGDQPYVRQLKFKRTRGFETMAMEVVADMDGRPFPNLRTAQQQFAAGRRGKSRTDRTLFCAELVAEAFMRLGVLSLDPPPNAYSPKDFSDQHRALKVLKGVLGPEMKVIVPTVRAKAAKGTKKR